jgi:isoquinoline 1-oxidoreductase beta subunit
MNSIRFNRRMFLEGAAAASMTVALDIPVARAELPGQDKVINAWVRIGTDDRVILLLSQCEMGQGISTTLPAILADELGADWSRVRIENAPVATEYQNPKAHLMFTGNSESIQTFGPIMRAAGAAAREMLVDAAAKRWGVPRDSCRTEDGRVIHGKSGRHFTFGELVEDAAGEPTPGQPRLRPQGELKLIGRSIARRDIPSKVDGSAVFGIDFKVPGMVYAAVRQIPVLGGSVTKFDPASVLALPGVIAAVPVPNGVAIVAEHFWQAKTAAEALDITFGDGANANLDSASLEAQFKSALEGTDWRRTTNIGDAAGALAKAERILSREYVSPFQAHATMEPVNCTAHVTPDRCDVWGPTQGPEVARDIASAISGLPPEKVHVQWTLLGGGFGRKALTDFVAHAVAASKAVGRPVKVIWTREDDLTHGYHRPGTLTRVTAVLGKDGQPTAIASKLVSPSQLQAVVRNLPPNVDPRCTEGLEKTRYRIPNLMLDFHRLEVPIPTSFLRTTGFGPNIFALESFVDELAHDAGADPYKFRRALLAHDRRAAAVLDLAAKKADWGKPMAKGHGRGIAFTDAFETLVAQVVELSVDDKKAIRVQRVVTVADPGKIYDPGITTSNLEGGVIWGLTSVLKSELTFEKGQTMQTNFDSYDVVHLWETPRVLETHLIEGGGDTVGGIGEVGPVAIPPAFANALFAATGDRVRSRPVSRSGYSSFMPS